MCVAPDGWPCPDKWDNFPGCSCLSKKVRRTLFSHRPNANFFAPAIEKTDELVVPSVSIFEVFKRMRQQKGNDAALKAVTAMMQGQVIDLDSTLALSAARLSGDLQIPMADSVILAIARAFDAELWTQDADLKSIENVRSIEKK